MPVPEFNTFDVNAMVSVKLSTDRYSYQYSFSNPPTNTGSAWHIKIDITQRSDSLWNYAGLTLPFGTKNINFIDMYNTRKPFALPPGVGIVPIGQIVPTGWVGGFGRDGTASFAASTGSPMLDPGSTKDGFVIISPGLPIIRRVEIKPHWVLLVEDHDNITFAEKETAATISNNLTFVTYTLGPSGNINKGSFDHWNLIRDNINKAVELNWIKDQAFANSLVAKLLNARTAANNQDGKLARVLLEDVLLLLNSSTLTQRNQEMHDLVFYHVQSLIKYTYDILPRFEPALTVTPVTMKLPIGTLHIIKAKVINLADYNIPVSGFQLFFNIISGPHRGIVGFGITDNNGEYEFKYVGSLVGKDNIVVEPAPPQ